MGQTREQRVIKQLTGTPQVQKQVPIMTNMFLPNHSGTHDAGILNKIPSKDNDLVNKKYVDDEIAAIPTPEVVHIVTCDIDGHGIVPTTGLQGFIRIGYSGTITSWNILAMDANNNAVSASAVVDIWRDTYANFPPTIADTITGTEKLTLTNQSINQDLNLTTWDTTITRGDVLAFNLDSCSTATRIIAEIRIVS